MILCQVDNIVAAHPNLMMNPDVLTSFNMATTYFTDSDVLLNFYVVER